MPATGSAAPELDARRLQAEVWQLRQLLADVRTLQGWTAACRLADDGNDLSVHRHLLQGMHLPLPRIPPHRRTCVTVQSGPDSRPDDVST